MTGIVKDDAANFAVAVADPKHRQRMVDRSVGLDTERGPPTTGQHAPIGRECRLADFVIELGGLEVTDRGGHGIADRSDQLRLVTQPRGTLFVGHRCRKNVRQFADQIGTAVRVRAGQDDILAWRGESLFDFPIDLSGQ